LQIDLDLNKVYILDFLTNIKIHYLNNNSDIARLLKVMQDLSFSTEPNGA